MDRISFDETLMRGYSRQLDFLELNPLVDLRRITKLTIHPTLLKKKILVPQNEIDPIIGLELLREGPL